MENIQKEFIQLDAFNNDLIINLNKLDEGMENSENVLKLVRMYGDLYNEWTSQMTTKFLDGLRSQYQDDKLNNDDIVNAMSEFVEQIHQKQDQKLAEYQRKNQ